MNLEHRSSHSNLGSEFSLAGKRESQMEPKWHQTLPALAACSHSPGCPGFPVCELLHSAKLHPQIVGEQDKFQRGEVT